MEVGSVNSSMSDKDDGVDYNIFYGNMESVTYRNDSHSSDFLRVMKSLYEEKLLTDIKLCVDGYEIICHRNVLAAISPYFKAMFTLDLNESKQGYVNLHEVEAESVEQIVRYAYSGSLQISRSNVQNLLAAASLFQILPVQKACARFLETQLDSTNCIGIHYFAQIHGCESLRVRAMEHIEKNFTEVCKQEEFLQLPQDKVIEIINSDELNVDREEIIFDAVIAWVSFDNEEEEEITRDTYLGDIFLCVRLGLLPARFIQETMSKNTFIKDCVKCQEILQNWRSFESHPGQYLGKYNFGFSLRSGMIRPDHCLLLIGGVEQRLEQPTINCYNPLTRETFCMEDFPTRRKCGEFEVEDVACVVSDKNTVYVGGGNYVYHDYPIEHFDSDDSCDELEERVVRKEFYCYDNDHNRWIQLSPMLFAKSNFTLAHLAGKIYCFGGVTENQHPTEIIEVYDIERNKWSYQGMLPTTLVDLASVTYEDYIYLLGGRTGVNVHNLVVMFNPQKSHWITRASMHTSRFNFGACLVDHEIYIAGGQVYSHASHTITREALQSVEIFNIHSNQWRKGPDLPVGMYNVGLNLINRALYACGTAEYQRNIPLRVYRQNLVYRLNFSLSRWEQIEDILCETKNFQCVAAKLHTRKLSQVFRPTVDT